MKKEPEFVLKGTLVGCESGQNFFRLASHFKDKKLSVCGVRITPEPSEEILVFDIKVLRNSQLANAGVFKASILNNAEFCLTDLVRYGWDVELDLMGIKQGDSFKVEIELKEISGFGHLLFCSGPSQAKGLVAEVYASTSLLKALRGGEVAVSMVHREVGHEHQEAPETVLALKLEGNRLSPEKPTDFSAGNILSFRFSGLRKDDFSPQDLVAVMKLVEYLRSE